MVRLRIARRVGQWYRLGTNKEVRALKIIVREISRASLLLKVDNEDRPDDGFDQRHLNSEPVVLGPVEVRGLRQPVIQVIELFWIEHATYKA